MPHRWAFSALRQAHHRRWRLLQAVLDVAAWLLALWFATFWRYDVAGEAVPGSRVAAVIILAIVLHLLSGALFHLYQGRHRFGSFDEALGVARAVSVTTLGLGIIDLISGSPRIVPLTVPIAAGFTAGVLMAATRLLRRASLEFLRRRGQNDATRVLVFGAGTGGVQAISAMLNDSAGPFLPVAALDDDPHKRRLHIRGVPVVGSREAMAKAAIDYSATILIIAVPSADAALLRTLTKSAETCGLSVKVVPSVGDLMSGRVHVSDIRDVNLEDLLGRHAVETDLWSAAEYLRGRRVLVTGAGGSIGSELCREISRFGPAKLIMLDRDESALHSVQLSISGRALMDDDDLVLADIREVTPLLRIFEHYRPDVVFHAAALKHLTMLERFPDQAVKTNVWGTIAVLNAATRSGVEHFVNVSTDKAADPSSVLGYSKRVAERLTSSVALSTGRHYVNVRFGNVLGSRGSVISTFTAQAASGGPITITHPDVSRFFMTVREAVQLVIQAAAIGKGGEVLVLDMGKPVRIADVASRVADAVNPDVSIIYTGLRPGEKLHETLFGSGETDARPEHPAISQVAVPPLSPRKALLLDANEDAASIIGALQELCVLPPSEVEVCAGGAPQPVIDLRIATALWEGIERRQGVNGRASAVEPRETKVPRLVNVSGASPRGR